MTNDELSFLNNLQKEKFFKEFDFCENEVFIQIMTKFKAHIKKIQLNGPTAQLFLQYFHCLIIVMNFYHAERSGDFKLHLECIKYMLPYFNATGHHNYSKSAHIYYQYMTELNKKIDLLTYEVFSNQGNFTIRCWDKFWCGIWTDMAIKQDLMLSIKCVGGLTRGRSY